MAVRLPGDPRLIRGAVAAAALLALSACGSVPMPGPQQAPPAGQGAHALPRVVVADFEDDAGQDGIPPGWDELQFATGARHTVYTVIADGQNRCLHATAQSAASGLFRAVSIDPARHPILTWRWRVQATLPKGDARTKQGDDFAARVYVGFRYDPREVGALTRWQYERAQRRYGRYPPLHMLCYVWANRLEPGTFIPNAWSGRVMMVALRSGDAEAGTWMAERRNVRDDYVQAFGTEPPWITQVVVMTDTDNTESFAEADYDDIRFEAPSAP